MKIIISPAKNMKVEEVLDWETVPVFKDKAMQVMNYLKAMDYQELKDLWGCNDKIAAMNQERLEHMNLDGELSPAVMAYDGIQYKYMCPGAFTDESYEWLKDNLRILSGFYGILRPQDGIVCYRLEMQAKAHINGSGDLYDFWGDAIHRELTKDDMVILNLASKEYSKCIEDYLQDDVHFIDIVFGEINKGKVVTKGTLAKMARGEMVRFLAERKATSPQEAKLFDRLGYTFDEDRSDENTYVYIRTGG